MSQEAKQDDDENVQPNCGASLTGSNSTWTTADPAVYPPGYPRLCEDCFPEADVDEDGYAPDFDHTTVVDVFVRTIKCNNSTHRMHRKVEVAN